jgi:Icc protein
VTLDDSLLTFVHISDTHIHQNPAYNKDYAEVTPYAGAQALVDHINALPYKPDFVLHTGDVAYNPDPGAYATCREILGAIACPVHYVAGNHDEQETLQTYMQPELKGSASTYYEFEVNAVQIIIADSNGPVEPPAGYVTDDQLTWLNRLCSADDRRPLVVAVHHNVLPVGIPWLDGYMGMVNGEQFHAAILPARDRLRGVFFGHVHQNIDVYRDGILYCSTLSSWVQFDSYPDMTDTVPDPNAEPGYSLVIITPNQTFIRRCRFVLPR